MNKIESPVLLVLANGYYKTRIQKQVAAIADKQILIMPTGHFVMLDDPEGFYKAIDDFLDAHPSDDE
jgi:pimeloyl-ACP methyl ester carboxylesterase